MAPNLTVTEVQRIQVAVDCYSFSKHRYKSRFLPPGARTKPQRVPMNYTQHPFLQQLQQQDYFHLTEELLDGARDLS